IKTAADAGLLVVAISGNEQSNSDYNSGGCGCSTRWPSLRGGGLTVGALQTGDETFDSPSLRGDSSFGGMQFPIYNGPTVSASIVGLVAPGVRRLWAANPTGYGAGEGGTSFAAPVVAGAAALMRDQLFRIGRPVSTTDARDLKVNMLLQGDRYDHLLNPPSCNSGTGPYLSTSGASPR